MIFVLFVMLLGLALLFLVLILTPAKDSVGHQFVAGVRAPSITQAQAVADDPDLPPASGWTALDDQQLARFLKGSETS